MSTHDTALKDKQRDIDPFDIQRDALCMELIAAKHHPNFKHQVERFVEHKVYNELYNKICTAKEFAKAFNVAAEFKYSMLLIAVVN